MVSEDETGEKGSGNDRSLRGIYFCDPSRWPMVYGQSQRAAIGELLEIDETCLLTRENWRQHRDILRDTRILVSTWGAPVLDEAFLEAAPQLELLLYGAGTVRGIATDAAWERGIRITAAADANAVPVAEFTLSQILFCLKNGWQLSRRATAGEDALWGADKPLRGAYDATVGLVSLSRIGTKVARFLRPFDLRVLAYDPLAAAADFGKLGAEPVGLEELFARSDVVSVHAPLLPETRGLVDGPLLRSMPPEAALINTARGPIVDESALVEVLGERPDLTAVLDVTDPEPPPPDSPLRTLPNAVLTPHMAGAFNGECRRLGESMVQELRRYLDGQPLKWEVTSETLAHSA